MVGKVSGHCGAVSLFVRWESFRGLFPEAVVVLLWVSVRSGCGLLGVGADWFGDPWNSLFSSGWGFLGGFCAGYVGRLLWDSLLVGLGVYLISFWLVMLRICLWFLCSSVYRSARYLCITISLPCVSSNDVLVRLKVAFDLPATHVGGL